MTITLKRTVNLSAPILPEMIGAPFYEGEKNAHIFVVRAEKNSAPYALSGSVVGYFSRADGNTVRIEGEIIDGEAVLTLTQECYMTGAFFLSVMLVEADAQTAIYAASGRIKNTQSGEIIDGGDVIPSYDEILAHLEKYLNANLSAKVVQTETEVTITLTDADGETQAVIPISEGLPDTTNADNNKFLMVENGAWTIKKAEEAAQENNPRPVSAAALYNAMTPVLEFMADYPFTTNENNELCMEVQ